LRLQSHGSTLGKDAESFTSRARWEASYHGVTPLRRDGLQWFYGTAWKEEETAGLTRRAIAAGFRAIDTANQRRHYFEAAVGEAIAGAIATGLVRRDELFVQTKFTHRDGQDDRLPYEASAPVAAQVEQSFASSLGHLGIDHIDSVLLHGPQARSGLGDEDWEAWRALERLARAGQAGVIGISNVNLAQLEALCAGASVKPAFVQNRCYASRGWDRAVRRYCATHGIGYQAFSLLTANRPVLEHANVRAIASRAKRTAAQVVFRFAIQAGMIALTGTRSAEHMAEDLAIGGFELTQQDVRAIEQIAG
jgi:diketogulonate reductase-like aldo/keto reductase